MVPGEKVYFGCFKIPTAKPRTERTLLYQLGHVGETLSYFIPEDHQFLWKICFGWHRIQLQQMPAANKSGLDCYFQSV